jgi:hypothetical protein
MVGGGRFGSLFAVSVEGYVPLPEGWSVRGEERRVFCPQH